MIDQGCDLGVEFDRQLKLVGEIVELRPLEPDDFEKLYGCASDPLIWEVHPEPDRFKREVFERFFKSAIESKGAFAIYDRKSGRMIGSSRYYDVDLGESSVIIGYTFLTTEFWGGSYNRDLKTVMLGHAFGSFENVFFQIGENNVRSRRAIEKIGAKVVFKRVLNEGSHVIYLLRKSDWLSSPTQ